MKKPMIHNNPQSGQAILLIAMLMVALIASLGLAIDGGGMFLLYRDVQNATDAAGLSAAYALCTGQPVTDIVTTSALENGFENNVDGATVLVENPPTTLSATYTTSEYVAVQITAEKPSYFIQIVYPGALTISATTIARCQPSSDSGMIDNVSILTLGTSCTGGQEGFNVTGSSDVIVHGSIQIEDPGGCSTDIAGSGNLRVDDKLCARGGVTYTGGGVVVGSDGSAASADVEASCDDVDPITDSDPLGLIADPPTCPAQATPYTSLVTEAALNGGSAPPGVYTDLDVSPSDAVTMGSGTYCVTGSSKVQGDLNTHADGVTIYVMCSTCLFEVTSQAHVDLVAQQIGDYAGLLLVAATDKTPALTHTWNGGGTLELVGTIYAPYSDCSVNGGSGSVLYAQFICRQFQAAGGAGLEIYYLPSATYQRPPEFGLTE